MSASALALVPHSPEWYADRRDTIGASDAPVIVGVAPRSWGDPTELLMRLYAEKTGLITHEQIDAMDTPEQAARKRMGLLMEEALATWYADTTKRKLRVVNSRPRHPEHAWMACSLDRMTVGVKPKRIVQLKIRRSDGDWGDPGTGEVPDDVIAQEQHEMAVTGAQVADVAVLIGGNDPRIYTIERDEGYIADLIELEAEFAACVRERRIPDYSGLLDASRRIRVVDGETVATPDVDRLIEAAYAATVARQDAEKAEKAAKAALIEQIDPYALVRGSAVDVIYRPNRPSTKVTWELVAKAYRKAIEEARARITEDEAIYALDQIDLDAIESTFTVEQAGARPIRFSEHREKGDKA